MKESAHGHYTDGLAHTHTHTHTHTHPGSSAWDASASVAGSMTDRVSALC